MYLILKFNHCFMLTTSNFNICIDNYNFNQFNNITFIVIFDEYLPLFMSNTDKKHMYDLDKIKINMSP